MAGSDLVGAGTMKSKRVLGEAENSKIFKSWRLGISGRASTTIKLKFTNN